MEEQFSPDFEEDAYIEWLLKLRESDAAIYSTYPQAVRNAVDEYEREKREAQQKKQAA